MCGAYPTWTPDRRLARKERHQKRGGNSLSDRVRDDDADLVLEYPDPVVIITRDLFSRKDIRTDVKILDTADRASGSSSSCT